MKPGVRALGIAESYRDERSTLAGAVVRADGVVDGLSFSSCTVGGTDATAATRDLVDRLAREDVEYVFVGAVAPAWYNVLDLEALHEAADRPVLAVTFEASEGLADALREEFSGEALDERLQRYRRLPSRRECEVNDETVYVRALGIDSGQAIGDGGESVDDVVRGFTPSGGRSEPLRVARLAARAGDEYVRVRTEEE